MAKKRVKKRVGKKRGGSKAFGGYTINFGKCSHSARQIFGSSPVAPSQMTKKLWAHIKACKLAKK
ncbi:MAG: hypothetical protein AABX59_03540 [Nanoarchaeota archaeon]